jgi:hypothetical protein
MLQQLLVVVVAGFFKKMCRGGLSNTGAGIDPFINQRHTQSQKYRPGDQNLFCA